MLLFGYVYLWATLNNKQINICTFLFQIGAKVFLALKTNCSFNYWKKCERLKLELFHIDFIVKFLRVIRPTKSKRMKKVWRSYKRVCPCPVCMRIWGIWEKVISLCWELTYYMKWYLCILFWKLLNFHRFTFV